MKEFEVSKPFLMDGTYNFREIGGYPADGGTTARGRFFRSDGLSRLSDADRAWMRERDITCVIDLRRPEERGNAPDALDESFEYHAVSLSDRLYDEAGNRVFTSRLSELYQSILNTHQKEIAEVMHIIAARGKRPLVFHCTAGKDRTGLTAMFLLSLAGVPEDVIAADYAASGINMKPFFDVVRERLRREGQKIPEIMFGSPAEDMQLTLAYIRDTWGTPWEYLKQCGVPEAELEQIRQNILTE